MTSRKTLNALRASVIEDRQQKVCKVMHKLNIKNILAHNSEKERAEMMLAKLDNKPYPALFKR